MVHATCGPYVGILGTTKGAECEECGSGMAACRVFSAVDHVEEEEGSARIIPYAGSGKVPCQRALIMHATSSGIKNDSWFLIVLIFLCD